MLLGKIDLRGAEMQSMNTLLSEAGAEADSLPLKSIPAADISFTAGTMIKLETLSWMESIRRKHGFLSPSDGPPQPSKDGGRRATAAARAKVEAKNIASSSAALAP